LHINELSAQELAAAINKKSISLEDLAAAVSSRCGAAAEKFNAFIDFDPAIIDREIIHISGLLHNGEETSLSGVPYALADNICTASLKTTCASRMLASYQFPFEATAAQRLKENGALLTGKTNMDEFAMSASGVNSCFGAVKNPWDGKHTAGSGAAAAVAYGAVTFALEQDRCGELRQSAAYCGALGLKPTYGRISRSGLVEFAPSLEQIGIIAMKTVDLAAVLAIISGPDPLDPTSCNADDVPAYSGLLHEKAKPIKVAVPESWGETAYLEEAIKNIFTTKLQQMEEDIFQVETVSMPYFRCAPVTAAIISAVEAFSNLSNYDGVRFGFRETGKHLQEMYRQTRTDGFSGALKQFLTFGAMVSSGKFYHDYFLKAQKMRTLIKQELEECLGMYDLVVVPTTPCRAPALKNGFKECLLPDPAASYTAAANLAGMPALTFPILMRDETGGINTAGLHLMAKPWNEAILLQAALILEKTNPLAFP
jgi:aspartyl-tRNA(Asn)/glutamyl-tRNA(Gln) amidotransferase subunit A